MSNNDSVQVLQPETQPVVVFIDPWEPYIEMVRHAFLLEKFQVVSYSSPAGLRMATALETIDKQKPDAVVVALNWNPGKQSFEGLELARELNNRCLVVVTVTPSFCYDHIVELTRLVGKTGGKVYPKQLATSMLVDMIKNGLQKRRLPASAVA